MGKFNKEDIILLFLDDPEKLEYKIWNRNVPKSDEIRTLICELGDPECAYAYARYIDKSPRSDTRESACKDPLYAYCYTLYVDKSPRSDTRRGASKDPECAYAYARYIDKSPRSDTRSAAYKDSYWKERYEQWELNYWLDNRKKGD